MGRYHTCPKRWVCYNPFLDKIGTVGSGGAFGYNRLSKNHRALSSWDLCPQIVATKSKICLSQFQHLPTSSYFSSLSEIFPPWKSGRGKMTLLRSCMRFLTSLSRHPESCDAAGPAPSEGTAPCTPQMPWFQFGL